MKLILHMMEEHLLSCFFNFRYSFHKVLILYSDIASQQVQVPQGDMLLNHFCNTIVQLIEIAVIHGRYLLLVVLAQWR